LQHIVAHVHYLLYNFLVAMLFNMPWNLFNLIKGTQMVQNKKFGAALALIAGLAGMGVSGSALALPEMDVGSIRAIAAPDSLDTIDEATAEPEDATSQDSADAQATSN
jgi:hypothetical protein